MKTLLIFSFLAWSTGVALGAVSVVAEWDANVEPEVDGYRVLVGSSSQRYTSTNTVVGRTNTTVTLTNLPPVAYIVVQAYSGDGRVSPLSYEVVHNNRFAAPLRLRVRTVITIEGTP